MAKDRAPQARRVTIKDIAERAGVSIGAVSFALNGRDGVSEATRERVRQVADELGWAPSTAARSLAVASTEMIGLVLARDPDTLGIETFYMRFIAGMESELAIRGYALLMQLVPTPAAELEAIAKWRATRRVDGVLLVDLTPDDPRVDLLAASDDLPTVVVGDASVADGLTSVSTDDDTAMREAVRYLASLGHRRIARVAGLDRFAHTAVREVAFLDEAERLGLSSTIARTDYLPESGRVATRSLLDEADRPTAIIYDNDVMAVTGLSVAMERGLSVPSDLSIIAWDDSVLCEHTFPQLTALRRDVVGFGAHVVRRLLDLIDGAERGAYLDETPRLVVRGSTGPA
ncbi:LacI family transcriptional regulator [Agromyces fucosus]|uniref:LacI family transcriptional regulator n=1 Tax=Agromyces fucosus TaxID=41985 RepID=A0A4Q2JT57_9MICO|nr:LacI family DNA-binding transcriptional regulator [Agromyces fucosus]RXZ50434.1 LacI family transcriptional regulator [Agromyces fucosus]